MRTFISTVKSFKVQVQMQFSEVTRQKSLLLNPTMTLSDIITAIQSSITNNYFTPIIIELFYRCPVYEFNGQVQYRAIQIIDEEGVLCMFHTFVNMTSVICIELKVDVHNSLSPTQVNDLS